MKSIFLLYEFWIFQTGQPPPFGPSGASASAKGGHGGSTVVSYLKKLYYFKIPVVYLYKNKLGKWHGS